MQIILGELEQKIMDVIWKEDSPMRPVDVKDKLEGGFAYTTIMTILTRLFEKGILNRKLEGKVYKYWPKKKRESFLTKKLDALYEDLVSSYGDIAISRFMETIKDNPGSIDILKKYIEDNEN